MSTITTGKKAHRGHLIRAAQAGKLRVKCWMRLTDDCDYDIATHFGRSNEFRQVYVRTKCESENARKMNEHFDNCGNWNDEVEQLLKAYRRELQEHRRKEERDNPGCLFLDFNDFRTKSGYARGTTDRGTFAVHSKLVYSYEVRDG